jgi:hypothetical protein
MRRGTLGVEDARFARWLAAAAGYLIAAVKARHA